MCPHFLGIVWLFRGDDSWAPTPTKEKRIAGRTGTVHKSSC